MDLMYTYMCDTSLPGYLCFSFDERCGRADICRPFLSGRALISEQGIHPLPCILSTFSMSDVDKQLEVATSRVSVERFFSWECKECLHCHSSCLFSVPWGNLLARIQAQEDARRKRLEDLVSSKEQRAKNLEDAKRDIQKQRDEMHRLALIHQSEMEKEVLKLK